MESAFGYLGVILRGMHPWDRAEFRHAFTAHSGSFWNVSSITDLPNRIGWVLELRDNTCWIIAPNGFLDSNKGQYGRRVGPVCTYGMTRFWQVEPRSDTKSTSVRLKFPRAISNGRRPGDYGHLRIVLLLAFMLSCAFSPERIGEHKIVYVEDWPKIATTTCVPEKLVIIRAGEGKPETLAHEAVHVEQQETLGCARFLVLYARDPGRFEIPAYKAQYIARGCKGRESILRTIKEAVPRADMPLAEREIVPNLCSQTTETDIP